MAPLLCGTALEVEATNTPSSEARPSGAGKGLDTMKRTCIQDNGNISDSANDDGEILLLNLSYLVEQRKTKVPETTRPLF